MTATWQSRDELVHQIVTLAANRVSMRAIARVVGVGRNTVKAVLAAHAAQRGATHSALPKPTSKAPRPKKTDAFRDRRPGAQRCALGREPVHLLVGIHLLRQSAAGIARPGLAEHEATLE